MLARIKSKYYSLDQSPLYKLRSRSKLAKILGLTNGDLRRLLATEIKYTEFDISKKNGGERRVENPCRPLKRVQEKIARRLSRIAPPDFLFCPVKGRCYVKNAARHVGSRSVRCLDIRKFYPSTPATRVFWFFRNVMKCASDIAGVLTRLSTYSGHLPTGSPLSPILAYFSFYDLWESMNEFCRQRGYVLSVYVDDVTISGHKIHPADLWAVKEMIHGKRLSYHKEKSYDNYVAEITGVIVDRDGLASPNRQHHKLAKSLAELNSSTEQAVASLVNRVTGLRGQMAQVEKATKGLVKRGHELAH